MTLPFTRTINNKPTFFIEKIWKGLLENGISNSNEYLRYLGNYQNVMGEDFNNEVEHFPKLHTIRRGERWLEGMPIQCATEIANGEMFNFAPEVICTSIQIIKITQSPDFQVLIDGSRIDAEMISSLVRNDGFDSLAEFKSYFCNDFVGQIVHWTASQYVTNQ